MNTAILIPMYGRDYKSKDEVIAAFDSLQDFRLCNIGDQWVDKPCNKNDLQKFSDYTHVELRYKKKEQCVIIPLT